MGDIKEVTIKRQKYAPRCSVCRYMRTNRDFRYRIMQSTYFNPVGKESMPDVLRSFKQPFTRERMYMHFYKHQQKEKIHAAASIDKNGVLVIDNRMAPTLEVIENIDPRSQTNHELGLDELIAKGRDLMARGDLKLTTSNYLAALRLKIDNDAKTKDRRVDMIKGLFKGAAPKTDNDGV